MYPKYCQGCKKMSLNEIKAFKFGSYYKRIGFSKKNSYYSMKNQKERSAFLCTESVKHSEIITYQPKNFENSNIAAVKK